MSAAASGAFISEDPTGQSGDTNLYRYASDSPTTYTDPSGDNPLLASCAVDGPVNGGLDYAVQRLSGRKANWSQAGTSAPSGCSHGHLSRGPAAL